MREWLENRFASSQECSCWIAEYELFFKFGHFYKKNDEKNERFSGERRTSGSAGPHTKNVKWPVDLDLDLLIGPVTMIVAPSIVLKRCERRWKYNKLLKDSATILYKPRNTWLHQSQWNLSEVSNAHKSDDLKTRLSEDLLMVTKQTTSAHELKHRHSHLH